ncbi:CLUMA_CG003998, isoform A [Clunio marinus]|uniref:CLUMA_CG003998, isoform A n=1 Tax=Clunio marinus TaxID=568069 RepID=A0A1J1HV65_9DIPT|nr:CLUMA_CG003998, isoform A [Clunio marinus]
MILVSLSFVLKSKSFMEQTLWKKIIEKGKFNKFRSFINFVIITRMNIFCLICCEPYIKSEDIVSRPCGHVFHRNCIEHWFRTQQSCPKCRAAINTQNFIQLFFDVDETKRDFQKDIEQHKKVIADLKEQLTNHIEINKMHMVHMKSYEGRIDLMKEENACQREQILCNEEQIQSMKLENSDLKKQLSNHIEMNKMHMSQMKISERRINSMKEENACQREQIMELLKGELRNLHENNKKLEQEQQNAFRIIAHLEGRMNEKQEKITECEQKIEKNKLNDNANDCQSETEITTVMKVGT